jgi:glycosyltransferase involved in cell wall biosynthesis
VEEAGEDARCDTGCDTGVVNGPAVSVCVTTYNHERFVEQCLDSIAHQTFDDFELVVVDDCSTDRTVERIEIWLGKTSLKAQLLVNNRNLGICASRNIGLRRCRGQFLSSVSGDDYYEPNKLEHQYRFFQTVDATTVAVFSNMRLVDEHGRECGVAFPSGSPPAEGRIFDRLIGRGNFLPAPAVLVRRTALEETGGYDESLFYEDYDMWLRLADRYEFRFLAGLVANYRRLRTSASRNPAYSVAMNESRARILLKWYGRDPHTDEIVLRRAWSNGRRVLAGDRRRGRRVLQAVCSARPSLRRRVGVGLSAVPGAGKALAGVFVVADNLRAAIRTTRASTG